MESEEQLSKQMQKGIPSSPQSSSIENQTAHFFNEIVRFKLKNEKKDQKIAIVVVSHAVYDLRQFLEALQNINIGRIYRIIFKSSRPNQQIIDEIHKLFPTAVNHAITKEKIKDNMATIYEIADGADKDEKILIIDIGGYFASCIPIISKDHSLTYKIIGIVEDTENGQQKYEKRIEQSSIPIFSVARCQQKRTEDYNVGKSIVNTADMLLKNIQVRSEEMICGVIGFGKIGSSIADHLRQKRVKKLFIFDRDFVVLMRAASLDFSIASKADILKKCNMIYCATGQKSLSLKDLEEIESNNVYIASCTSSDDEFECNVSSFDKRVINEGQANKADVSVYRSQKGKTINFLAHGNAVNFYLQNNALGNYIRGVQAAILVCALKLINGERIDLKRINELNYSEEKVISRLWLKYFTQKKYQIADRFLVQSKDKQKFILEENVRAIEHILETRGYCCLYGENGTGKTEVARKIAQKNEDYYELIWYVDEANEGTAYKELARKINMSLANKTKEELLEEIFLKLLVKKSFLIVFDNVNEQQIMYIEEVFRNVFTKNQAAFKGVQPNEFRSNLIFITTSKPGTVDDSRLYELKPLSVSSLNSLLNLYYKKHNPQVNLLHELSGGYPFLLDKILSYLEFTRVNLDTYRKDYNDQVQKKSTSRNVFQSVDLKLRQEIIMSIAIDKIKEWTERGQVLAYELMLFSTLLDGDCIEFQVFAQFFQMAFEISDKRTLKYAINLLEKYGIFEIWQISDRQSDNPYFMRKLTQNIIYRNWLNNDNFPRYFFYALQVVNYFFQYQPYRKQTGLEKYHSYVSHASVIMDNLIQHPSKEKFYSSFEKQQLLNILEFLYKLASIHLYEYRNYEKCVFFFKEMNKLISLRDKKAINDKEIRKLDMIAMNGEAIGLSHLWKKDSEKKIEDFNNLLSQLNEFDLTETNLQESSLVQIDETLLQVDILINQSYIKKYLGRYYMKIEKVKKGKEDLDASLATLLQVKEILKNCKETNEEAVQKAIALASHALGSLYLQLDKYISIYLFEKPEEKYCFLEKAKEELEQAIALRKQILESSHPDLARSYYKYSCILWDQYNKPTDHDKNTALLQEALRYCKLAISAQEKSLSTDHINLIQSKELKRHIKYELNHTSLALRTTYVSPWTPAKDIIYNPSPRNNKKIVKMISKNDAFKQPTAMGVISDREIKDQLSVATLMQTGVGGGSITTGLVSSQSQTLSDSKQNVEESEEKSQSSSVCNG